MRGNIYSTQESKNQIMSKKNQLSATYLDNSCFLANEQPRSSCYSLLQFPLTRSFFAWLITYPFRKQFIILEQLDELLMQGESIWRNFDRWEVVGSAIHILYSQLNSLKRASVSREWALTAAV